MHREQRRKHFGSLLETLMRRAEVGDTELSQRLGVSRITVRRWRTGEALPKEEAVRPLRAALRWMDEGVLRELSAQELNELLLAAGYYTDVVHTTGERSDRSQHAVRAVVYSEHYSSGAFPSGWSSRIIEVERSTSGAIYCIRPDLPSITRVPAYYEGAYTSGLYRRDLVEAYIAQHAARQDAFLERLAYSEVHHLYSKQRVEAFVDNAWRGQRPDRDVWSVSREALSAQLGNIIEWLRTYDNFEIRLREGDVPGDVTVIGHGVVLLSSSLTTSLMDTDNVAGVELVGADAAVQFTKQFSSLWSHPTTLRGRDDMLTWLKDLQSTLK